MIRLAVMIATTVFLASFAPPGRAKELIAAIVSAHVTRWDEAAVTLALSLGAGMFVDPVAAEAAIAEAQQQQP